jgi:hypothetical protein
MQGCSGVTNESCAVIGKLVGLTSLLLNHCNHVGDQGKRMLGLHCRILLNEQLSVVQKGQVTDWVALDQLITTTAVMP